METYVAELNIRRRTRDGWYVYTCDTLPGLYVASQDDKKAFNDLPKAIQMLIKLDVGIDCVVSMKVDYQQLVRMAKLTERAQAAVRERTDEFLRNGIDEFTLVISPDQSPDATA